MLFCLQYSKKEEARFLAHLDLRQALERALRRARLPLAFSQGFNPHPRLAFGSALALGVTSDGEYFDLELRQDCPPQEIVTRLNAVLPRGLRILAAVPVLKRKKSLMALINLARYQVTISPFAFLAEAVLQKKIDEVLACTTFPVIRMGKKGPREKEIRPGVFAVKGWQEEQQLILQMDLQTGSQGHVRPEEVVGLFKEVLAFSGEENWRIHRLGLYIRENGKLFSPLEKA